MGRQSRIGWALMCFLALAGCRRVPREFSPPAIVESSSSLENAGRPDQAIRFTAKVDVGDAYEVLASGFDYSHPAPPDPPYTTSGELINPSFQEAQYDFGRRTVMCTLPTGWLGGVTGPVSYRWTLRYRLRNGSDIAETRSNIFNRFNDEDGPDLEVTFGNQD